MLSECFCIIDRREKNSKRIEAVKSFIESHNGAVEFGTLQLCDYKIEGIFREKEISIGIEAKSLTDFSGSYQDLPDKLARSFELYNDVCLFVEIPQFRTSSEDGFHAFIKNDAVTDGTADVLQYAVLQNSLASWQSAGVHVRQLPSEAFWGYSIASVLISITKDTHRGLEITKTKDFKSQYLNILTKFDGIGSQKAQKITKEFPNLHWLCTYDVSHLQECLGKVTGQKLFDFIHNNSLITSEWANNGSKSQLSKETEKSLKSNPEQSSDEFKYIDENKPKFIEVPKGYYVNGGEIRDINPERDHDIETLQSSSATAIKTNHLPTSKMHGTPDTPGENALSRDLQLSDDSKGKADVVCTKLEEDQQRKYDAYTRELRNNPHCSRSAITDDQPKAICNLSSQSTHAPSAASSNNKDKIICCDICGVESDCAYVNPTTGLCQPCQSNEDYYEAEAKKEILKNQQIPEPPDNSEFSANPRMKDIVEFIRKHPRTTDDVDKEFGLSKEYCFKALNELWHRKRIWFNKSSLQWEFGLDKNPAPVVADRDMDLGV